MKTWNMRKKKDAVSPVIATILMVAITVVLAAVLYVMVMGFGGDTNSNPTASLTESNNKLVISISESQTRTDGNIGIYVDGAVTSPTLEAATVTAGTNQYDLGDVIFVDAGGDGKINDGDYIIADTAYTAGDEIQLMWLSGGEVTPLASGSL